MSVGIACVSAFCDAVCVLRHGVMLLNLLCPLYKSARSRHCRRRDVLYSTHEGRGFISLNNVVHMKVITYSIVIILPSQAYLRGKIQLNRPKCQRRDSFATQQWEIKTGRFWSSDLGGRKKSSSRRLRNQELPFNTNNASELRFLIKD